MSEDAGVEWIDEPEWREWQNERIAKAKEAVQRSREFAEREPDCLSLKASLRSMERHLERLEAERFEDDAVWFPD